MEVGRLSSNAMKRLSKNLQCEKKLKLYQMQPIWSGTGKLEGGFARNIASCSLKHMMNKNENPCFEE